jgi:hypothetical protein
MTMLSLFFYAGNMEDDFVHRRMEQLQHWLDRVCAHPVLFNSQAFRMFLRIKEDTEVRCGAARMIQIVLYPMARWPTPLSWRRRSGSNGSGASRPTRYAMQASSPR